MHYLKYPVTQQYKIVDDFLGDLYQAYKVNDSKLIIDELYLVSCKYLRLVFCKNYNGKTKESLSKTQFIVVIATEYWRASDFLRDVIRPLLIDAQWISETNLQSKLVFFGRAEAALYSWQLYTPSRNDDDIGRLEREKRYLSYTIERNRMKDGLTLVLDILQMQYDKDFIAASKSSISASYNTLLAPTYKEPSVKIDIPACLPKKLLELPRFVLSKIFAESLHRISFAPSDYLGFYLDGEYLPSDLMYQFIVFEYVNEN